MLEIKNILGRYHVQRDGVTIEHYPIPEQARARLFKETNQDERLRKEAVHNKSKKAMGDNNTSNSSSPKRRTSKTNSKTKGRAKTLRK